jgi:carboxypeptidase Taq
MAAINKAHPDWRRQLAEGKLEQVNQWLKTNIHSQGDLYDPEELIKKATGTELNSESYLKYLNEKYGTLYGF